MTKPMVFNYADHERALEEIAKLKEDIANLQIRCRIAESEKPVSSDRDCKNCVHHKPDGCSRWDCEYEPAGSDLISRAKAIDAVCDECEWERKCHEECQHIETLKLMPSVEIPTSQNLARPNKELKGSDLISRADAIKEIEELPNAYNGWSDTYDKACIIGVLESLPSADRQEVESATINNEGITFYYRKKGEWIEEDEYGDLWVCDQCGFASEHRDNYCPNCGAKMRGEEE